MRGMFQGKRVRGSSKAAQEGVDRRVTSQPSPPARTWRFAMKASFSRSAARTILHAVCER